MDIGPAIDFTTPDAYKNLKVLNANGFDVVVLPVGSTIYRADATGKTPPSEGLPNFFSDKISIKPYTGSIGSSAISSYKTKDIAVLFVMSHENIDKLASQEEGIRKFVDGFYRQNDEKGNRFIIPSHVFSAIKKGDTLYYYNSNRVFADMICVKGFDGWIALPDNKLRQRNISTKYKEKRELYEKEKKEGKLEYTYNDYAPEIVICNWKKTMDYTGGKRSETHRRFKMPRRMTRKYCKKTPCRKMGFTQKASCRPYKNCFTARARRRSSRKQ